MTVYRRGGVWWYDFTFRNQRYRKSSLQTTREDAELVESQLKLQLRREAGGVAVIDRADSPSIQDWAEVYYQHAARKVTQPDRIKDLLNVTMRFWGTSKNPRPNEPYHDLLLLDPIADPIWIERFEQWMAQRHVQGQTRNHYRSSMSQLYKLAMAPAYRKITGVQVNPFLGLPRDRSVERTVTLSVDEIRRWLWCAGYHVRLAIAIAALAPKLRLRNVLDLEWAEHLDPALQRIVVQAHKTALHTGRPLVAPINEQLRSILRDARDRNRGPYVVAYRNRPIHSIRGGLKLAADRAGLHYGRARGITFHTIRHTMATMLAEMGEGESLRKELLGHERLETTQRYTHIRPLHQVAALERLSAATPIGDLVTLPSRRVPKGHVGENVPLVPSTDAETPTKTAEADTGPKPTE